MSEGTELQERRKISVQEKIGRLIIFKQELEQDSEITPSAITADKLTDIKKQYLENQLALYNTANDNSNKKLIIYGLELKKHAISKQFYKTFQKNFKLVHLRKNGIRLTDQDIRKLNHEKEPEDKMMKPTEGGKKKSKKRHNNSKHKTRKHRRHKKSNRRHKKSRKHRRHKKSNRRH